MTTKAKYYRRNLPHYFLPEACYFITYRLAGSLPEVKRRELKDDYQEKINQITRQKLSKTKLKNKTAKEWKKYFDKIDGLLHQYSNSPKYLQENKITEITANSLQYYDDEEYDLISYCIMPNHVHCILKLNKKSRRLDKILQSIKRYSATKSNNILNRKGQFWQHESYDYIIRNEQELENIVNYILYNPVKAGLVKYPEDWQWNYCRASI